MAQRVTLADVAAHAGTSHSSASRALNGRPGVRPELRESVLRSAEELGYLPNPAARRLVMERSNLLAMVVSDRDLVVGTEFFSNLVSGIITTVEEAGFLTLLLLPESSDSRKDLIHVILRERLEGVVLIGHRAGDDLVHLLDQNGVPTVCLGRPIDCPPTTYVDVANAPAAEQATRHLLEGGRRRIGMLAGPSDTAWGRDRLDGYEDALRLFGLDPDDTLVEVCSFDDQAGYRGMANLLDRRPDLDAVLCSSEALLRGALRALAERSVRIPDDIAFVTFDDGPAQAFGTPPLTAVRQPLSTLGAELGRSLLKMIEEGAPVHNLEVAASLEVRESSSAVDSAE